MRYLWKYIDNKKWNTEKKYKILLLVLSIISALSGFALWLLIPLEKLSSLGWMLCFTGYPVFISWFVAFFYSCSHEFSEGQTVNWDNNNTRSEPMNNRLISYIRHILDFFDIKLTRFAQIQLFLYVRSKTWAHWFCLLNDLPLLCKPAGGITPMKRL